MRKVIFGSVGLVLGLACGGGGGRGGGVKLPNEMDNVDQQHLVDNKILLPGERVLAFYDAGVMRDGTEETVVTDQRVVSSIDGHVTAVALVDVDKVDRKPDVVGGDEFTIVSHGVPAIKFTVAPLNGGDTMAQVLEGARSAASGPAAAP